MIKACSKCGDAKDVEQFYKDRTKADGREHACKACRLRPGRTKQSSQEKQAAKAAQAAEREAVQRAERARERAERLSSDHESLKPSDLQDEYSAPEYDREKKQEYNEQMGEFADDLRVMSGDPSAMAEFVSLTAEQERRWLNKRLARSVSLGAARDTLFLRQFEALASRVKWPERAEGFSRAAQTAPTQRMMSALFSDLHFGAGMPDKENPVGYNFKTAGRRWARLQYELGEMKTRYREHTTLNLGFNGDIIEGMLGWNDADNAPLAEQMVAAVYYMRAAVEYQAARWPHVEVHCQTGNHGRNKLTHPGRATSSKWNSYEMAAYKFLAMMCKHLPNVTFHIPKAPWSVIPLPGGNALMVHGDTEPALKSPNASGGKKTWNDALNFANTPVSWEQGSPLMYGAPIHVLNSGHFHEPDLFPLDRGWALSQGALVPSNGHARSMGYGSRCMFWFFESVPSHNVGDTRPVQVGPGDDANSDLDSIIAPFDFEEVA